MSTVPPSAFRTSRFMKSWQLLVLCAPALIFFIIFMYVPMYGVQIAFKDYSFTKGITGSLWVGFKHFLAFFNSYYFWPTLLNTIILGLLQAVLAFPIPVIVAIMLVQLRSERYERFVQTTILAPYFISVVVLVGMVFAFASPSTGIVNTLITRLGGKSIFFMGEARWFRPIFFFTYVWQTTGFQTIVCLGALTSISPELHEAAVTEGATKMQRIWHIDIPGILQVIIPLQIMTLGTIMTAGFQQTLLMQTPLNVATSEIISTYVYKAGILNARYSYAAAVGLFQNIVNLALLISMNRLSRRIGEVSLW